MDNAKKADPGQASQPVQELNKYSAEQIKKSASQSETQEDKTKVKNDEDEKEDGDEHKDKHKDEHKHANKDSESSDEGKDSENSDEGKDSQNSDEDKDDNKGEDSHKDSDKGEDTDEDKDDKSKGTKNSISKFNHKILVSDSAVEIKGKFTYDFDLTFDQHDFKKLFSYTEGNWERICKNALKQFKGDKSRETSDEILNLEFNLLSEDKQIRQNLFYMCMNDQRITSKDRLLFNENEDGFH